MKILAFTDVHGNENLINEVIKKAKSRKIDFAVCLGDLTIFGEEIESILKKFDNINAQVIIISGNHEEWIDLKKISKKFKNIIYLHKNTYEYKDYIFIGHGGGWFNQETPEFEKLFNKLKYKLKEKKIILLTHQPPYNTKLDGMEYFGHVGNKTNRKFIMKFKPVLAISGHLHENFGKIDKIGKTILINPGPLGRVIEI